MAKGCASCTGGPAIVSQSNVAPAMAILGRSQMLNELNSSNLQSVVYVGPDGAVESSLDSINYGVRQTGEKLWVSSVDIELNPSIFMTLEEYSKQQAKVKTTETKRKKKEVVVEESSDDIV